MKIIRTQFNDKREIISTIVLKNNVTRKEWLLLSEKCGLKCALYENGMPRMVSWNEKVNLITRTGHNFQFEYIK